MQGLFFSAIGMVGDFYLSPLQSLRGFNANS